MAMTTRAMQRLALWPELGYWAMIGEHLILRILRSVPARSLLRLMECSKSFYCFANYNKICNDDADDSCLVSSIHLTHHFEGKRICIKRWEGHFSWKGTWKLTALLPYSCDMTQHPGSLVVPQQYYDRFPVIGPRMRRATIPIENLTSTRQDLPYVDADTMSVEEFIEKYDRGNQPCIIRNAMKGWKTDTNWTPERLIERFGDKRFLTDEVNSKGHKMKMTLESYFSYFRNNKDDDPIYLFDPKFVKHAGEEIRADYDIPKYFQEDLFSILSKEERPFYRWIILGPKRSGSCFHLDPYFTSAWNALIRGTKRWVMYPPSWIPPGVTPNGRDDFDAPIPMKWFLQEYYKNPDGNANGCNPILPGALECQQQEGEIIWVPSGWWHMVLNVTDTIAVTQNLCNSANWRTVWPDVLKDRPMAEELKLKLGPTRPDLFPDYKEWLAARAAESDDSAGKKKRKKKKSKNKDKMRKNKEAVAP